MAYSSSTMRLMGGVPGQQMFFYKTADAKTTTDDSGYFDDAVDEYNLSTCDIILCVHSTGGTIGLHAYVATNTSGTVTVTDLA